MNIFDILREAKSPSKQPSNTLTISNRKPNDYTEDTSDDNVEELDATDNQDTNDSNDYTEEVNEVKPDDTQDETEEDTDDDDADYTDNLDAGEDDENSEEENQDEDGPVDYTDDMDSGEDGTTDEEQPSEDTAEEQSPEEQFESQQNLELLKSIIELYYSMLDICSKLDSIAHPNALVNRVNIQVKKNLTELASYLYTHITTKHNSNSYVKNLFVYNHTIESFKINIKMLETVTGFK